MSSNGYSQCFYSEKYKLIIGCHARCWSKSMNIWFGRLLGYDWPGDEKWYRHEEIANNREVSLWCFTDKEIKEKFKDYKVLFFTRNPYERVYSHILAHHQYQNKSFDEVLNTNFSVPPLKNELSSKIIENLNYEIIDFQDIRDVLNKIIIDNKIKITFEHGNYVKEYTHLQEYIDKNNRNLWDIPIGEINTNPCHCEIPNYKLIYNDSNSKIIYNKYKEDFDLFGYSQDFRIYNRLK